MLITNAAENPQNTISAKKLTPTIMATALGGKSEKNSAIKSMMELKLNSLIHIKKAGPVFKLN